MARPPESFKTPSGTELPLLNLRGKPYLQVAHRIIWFREEKPDWPVKTALVLHDEAKGIAVARSEIRNPDGEVVQTAHKMETRKGFSDYLEKAETGSLGRALALIGYGTQFATQDLDEGERLADAPIAPGKKEEKKKSVDKEAISGKLVAAMKELVDACGKPKDDVKAMLFDEFKGKAFPDWGLNELKFITKTTEEWRASK